MSGAEEATVGTSVPGGSKSDPEPTRGYRAYVLFILVVVYTFNFIDRQIIGILAPAIKADLGLSDTQLGLMSGAAFALFYTFLGIPIATLADRSNRTWIMTVALTVWSAMTAICGLAQTFWQLFAARLGVGAGEAGGVAPAYSLIADYFPPEKRARALSIFAFGIPIGSAIGIMLGGVLNDLLDWRDAFFIVGGAGILIAPIFRLTMREPRRGRFDTAQQQTEMAPVRAVLAYIAKKPAFWGLSFAAASGSMMGYGVFFWMPSFFVRSFPEALPEFFSFLPAFLMPENPSPTFFAGYFYGSLVLVGGLIGIFAGGVIADRLGARNKAAYALVPAVAFSLTVPLFIVGMLSQSLGVAFAVFLLPTGLALVWLGPVTSAFQHLVPPNMRATASAIFLFINSLIGIGLGQSVIGFISDAYNARFAEEALRYSILTGTIFYVIAAGLFFLTAPRLEKDWER